MIAGICGILLGGFGVHRFILEFVKTHVDGRKPWF